MIHLIFVFNFFDDEILCPKITLKRMFNCNKYFHFHITPIEEIWVYKIFLSWSWQGHSKGTSSVALEVLIMNCLIGFINFFIFNCLTTLNINLFIFNCLTSNFSFPKIISFAGRRERKNKKVEENGCLWTHILIFETQINV